MLWSRSKLTEYIHDDIYNKKKDQSNITTTKRNDAHKNKKKTK